MYINQRNKKLIMFSEYLTPYWKHLSESIGADGMQYNKSIIMDAKNCKTCLNWTLVRWNFP